MMAAARLFDKINNLLTRFANASRADDHYTDWPLLCVQTEFCQR